ncbi:MAG: glycosyl hydrolase family 65 protein [Anditalea sp.]
MANFKICYPDWKPEKLKLREALCTLGNGYFATRGAAEESKNDDYNYPGTYLAGGYNRAQSKISDRIIENEDLVNFPNWLYLNFRPEGGDWLNLAHCQVHEYEQNLDLRKGTLHRAFVVEDKQGRRSKIESRRFVSMRDMHNAALEWTLTPQNWSGTIEVASELDGTVINDGVKRYKDLESHHLAPVESKEVKEGGMLLVVETQQSKLVMAQAARTRIYEGGKRVNIKPEIQTLEMAIAQKFRLEVQEGHDVKIEKVIALYTSKDKAITEPSLEACDNIAMAGEFDELLYRHEQAWEKLWKNSDIALFNGDRTQQLLRLHIFHILQTASPNSIGLDVGIPSRGWHGEAYRGHVFWDELFITPFYNLRFPEITRSLLMYRFNRLDKAREAARKEGYKGAMFPWQSGSNGREESQTIHLNPDSGNWIPDNTHLQRHVNAAIAYNIWNYYISTEDQQFLSFHGAEMFLSIASFWASKASYNKKRERFEILQVVGPDEYHTSYPDSDEQGLKNNAYTNIMAAWVLQKALVVLDIIEKSTKQDLLERLEIDDKEIKHWEEVGKKMYVPFLEGNIISQFEGYGDLKEFPWEEYRKKYEDIQRLDRVLESEGDSPNKYKASKQADVLMLFYLFSTQQLKDIFNRLGYDFDENTLRQNVEYYRERTSHGSTLSRLVFSWILSRYDKQESWENFEALLISDFEDIQGGTTPEGIHLGAMAGSLDLIQRCFCGIEVSHEALWIKPMNLKQIDKIKFKIKFRGHWIVLSITKKVLRVSFEEGWSSSVAIGVIDRIYEFKKDEVKEFPLHQ